MNRLDRYVVRHVLGLTPLRPLGQDPDARDRGSIVHDIFGRFVEEQRDVMASDAMAVLDRMASEAFGRLETIGERRDIWQRRFRRAAELFLAFERERQPRVRARHAEITGEWTFPLHGGFVLRGRADRVDEMVDGGVEIIDFKTGSVPAAGMMKDYFAPQLPLEAELARLGGFRDVPAADPVALTYVKIGLGPDAFKLTPFSLRDGESLSGAVDAVTRRMQGHVDRFLFTLHPMAAQILVAAHAPPSSRHRRSGSDPERPDPRNPAPSGDACRCRRRRRR